MVISRDIYPLKTKLNRKRNMAFVHFITLSSAAIIMCSFSGATCTSRVRHNADYVPYANILFDL